jgi:nucleotide-binding universal stress UspA family protein
MTNGVFHLEGVVYNKILVPLDGSELSMRSLESVKQVAAVGVSDVILLTVVEPISPKEATLWELAGYKLTDVRKKNQADARDYLSQAAKTLNNQGISARVEVIEGRAAESILDYAEKNKIELIIISTHGRSGITRWAFGSVADRVVRHSPIPVLVISPVGRKSSG